MTKVGVVFGGRSVEHQVSIRSARTVAPALEEAGFEVVPFGIAEDGCWLDPTTSARALGGELDELAPAGERVASTLPRFLGQPIDVAFPLVHGTWGEDGTLQGLFEMADLPYVGPGVMASAVAMDKALTKRIVGRAGVPVVEYLAISRAEWSAGRLEVVERVRTEFGFPLFVKPAVGGSSVGVTRVPSAEGLETSIDLALELDSHAMVERAVSGRELECAVMGYPALESAVVGEIKPSRDFYDYADKYLEDEAELLIPAPLEPEIDLRVRQLAVAAFAAIGGTGMARVDFFLEGADDILFNEINTLPGFTSISMFPKLWNAAGVSLTELVRRLVDEARAQHRDRAGIDRKIKAFLDQLG